MLSDGVSMLMLVDDDIVVTVRENGRGRALPRRRRPSWPAMSDAIDTEALRCSG
jgi:hypothetical protein